VKHLTRMLVIMLALLTWTELADAQRRGGGGRGGGGFRGGGGGFSRASARPSVNHRPNISQRPATRDINRGNFNQRDRNFNQRDINIDRDVNVDVDRNWNRDGCCYHHPIARAAVATAAVATAAAIGTTVYTLPASCSSVYVNGVTYEQCGNEWYQPQFVGTSAAYIVVAAPQ
jgi:hypothetical protein